MKAWTIADIPGQTGRRALITGANSGIGYYAALELARKGAHVILACRDAARGEAALTRIRAEIPAASVELALLDLASLADIRRFAAAQLVAGHSLDLLILNAGVMAPPQRRQTVDGFELQFGTNVLGHFALTGLLFPALQQAAQTAALPPRIVTIASIAHKRGRLHFDDLQSERSYSPMGAYQQSKLADLVFALELDRRLRGAGSRILSVAAHPGVANTNLFHGKDYYSAFQQTVRRLVGRLIDAFLNSEPGGALPTLFAATAPQAKAGGYYGPQGLQEMRGDDVGPAIIAPQAQDASAAARLWQVCESLTAVSLL